MAGPILQLRAVNFDESKQIAMRKLLEQIVILEVERADYLEFHFKKGKTLGVNLKENSCLFLLNISTEDSETDDLESQDIAEKLDDNPVAFIGIAAMCNDKIDHYLLAELALEINKIVGGFIDLNGKIVPPSSERDKNGRFIDSTPEEIQAFVSQINGKIHEIHYEMDYEQTNYYHICDAEWLRNWTQHSEFNLIK
jgi:Family of unknown function (DUF6368)